MIENSEATPGHVYSWARANGCRRWNDHGDPIYTEDENDGEGVEEENENL